MRGYLGIPQGHQFADRCPRTTACFCKVKSLWGYLGIPFNKEVYGISYMLYSNLCAPIVWRLAEKVSLGIPMPITYFISMAYTGIRGVPDVSLGVPRIPERRHCSHYSRYYPEGTSQPVALAGARSPSVSLWKKFLNGKTHTLLSIVDIVVTAVIVSLRGIHCETANNRN